MKEIKDDEWGEVRSRITLTEMYAEKVYKGLKIFLILKLFLFS